MVAWDGVHAASTTYPWSIATMETGVLQQWRLEYCNNGDWSIATMETGVLQRLSRLISHIKPH